MTRLTDKKLLYVIMAVIATATITSYSSIDKLPQAQGTPGTLIPQSGIAFKEIKTPDSFIANGGKSAVKVEIPTDKVIVSRGNTVDVDIHIKHIAGVNPFPFVNVNVISPSGIYYPPSVAASTTPEQRMHAIETGKLISGSIDTSTLVSYSETNPVKILPNGEQVIVMHLSIPKNTPNEVVGNEILLSVPIQVTDSNGNSDTVAWENGKIVVIVG